MSYFFIFSIDGPCSGVLFIETSRGVHRPTTLMRSKITMKSLSTSSTFALRHAENTGGCHTSNYALPLGISSDAMPLLGNDKRNEQPRRNAE